MTEVKKYEAEKDPGGSDTFDKYGSGNIVTEGAMRVDPTVLRDKEMEILGDVALGSMRNFNTGATRDSEDGKFDYEGFFCPLVLERFAQYMHSHRKQADGAMRASDNWQKGIPLNVYMKSAWRHFMDVWMIHRGITRRDPMGNVLTMEDSCCALLFNILGYLHEILKRKNETLEIVTDPRVFIKELEDEV